MVWAKETERKQQEVIVECVYRLTVGGGRDMHKTDTNN